jgi:hypothetical protein
MQHHRSLYISLIMSLVALAGGALLARPGPVESSRAPARVPAAQGRIAPPAPLLPFQRGDVFAGVGSGQVNHYRPDGTLVQTLDTGSASRDQTGMCFDGLGNLYTTNWTAGSMSKFDSQGARTAYPWGGPFGNNPESCVADAQGNLYTGEVAGANRIRKWDLSGNLLASHAPDIEVRGVDWIDLAADQCTMYYTSEAHAIKRFNVCTNTQLSDFVTNLPGQFCFALRLRANGEVMVACNNQALRLNAAGAVLRTYPTTNYPGAIMFFATNLDPDGTSFWTGDYYTGRIYRIDIATGALLRQFTAPPLNDVMAGVAVYGEYTQAQPTATATAPPASATPPATATGTATPPAPTGTATAVGPTATVTSLAPTASATPLAPASATATPPAPTATAPPPAPASPTPPATPTPPSPCVLPFTDVDVYNPFHIFIHCLYCRGHINGYTTDPPCGPGTPCFRPYAQITRAQVAKIVANSAGIADPVSGQTFTDVPPSHPFYLYIERLAGRGLINGYSDPARCPGGVPCFEPAAPVTRGQLAKIAANAAGYSDVPPAGTQSFADVPVGDPFWLYIERLSRRGIIDGYRCGTSDVNPCLGVVESCDSQARPYYRPCAYITRGQTTKIVVNTFFPACSGPARTGP